MAIQYVYDANGFLIEIVDSAVAHPNSTTIAPTFQSGKIPRFMNGAWSLSASSYPVLTPMQFYLAFTATEMIDIKGSNDPMVKEFYARYQLAVQTNTPIDPNLVSVQEGLTYLATPTTATPPGAGILASTSRIAQISNGVPQ